MLENYKKFLINKMTTILLSLKEKLYDEYHYYFNFVEEELFCIVETDKKIFVIILNSDKDAFFELKHFISDYKRFLKNDLKSNLSKKSFKKLVKQGLYMNIESGKNSFNNFCTIQRLVCCIRENILNKEIDHLDENPLNNSIDNLKPQSPIKHREITTQRREQKRLEQYIDEKYITL